MKVREILNNYPKIYLNVLPPDRSNLGSMIAHLARTVADEQGNMPTEYEGRAEAGQLWPRDRFDRRAGDEGTAIAQRAKQLKKKNRGSPNAIRGSVSPDVIYR